MGPFVLAWLIGNGIITYRQAKELHMPPSPRALLAASGLFVGLAILAEYRPARGVATAFAFGIDLAVLLQVLPGSKSPNAITSNASAKGWAGLGLAGNTVVIPDGTVASIVTGGDAGTPGSLGSSTGSAGSGGTAAQNQAIAQQVIASNPQFSGWGSGSEWAALVSLWTKESSWSNTAANPSSGAFGVAQSLHGNVGGLGGNEYNSSAAEGLTATQLQAANNGNAADQILWGLNYILATYGTPSAALAKENSAGYY